MIENINNVSFCANLRNNRTLNNGISEAISMSQSSNYLENMQALQFANAVYELRMQPGEDEYCLREYPDQHVDLYKNNILVKSASRRKKAERNVIDVISNYVQKDLGINISEKTLNQLNPKLNLKNINHRIELAYQELETVKSELRAVEDVVNGNFQNDIAEKLNIRA